MSTGSEQKTEKQDIMVVRTHRCTYYVYLFFIGTWFILYITDAPNFEELSTQCFLMRFRYIKIEIFQ